MSPLRQILNPSPLLPPFQDPDVQTSRIRGLAIHSSVGGLCILEQLIPMYSGILLLG